MTRAGAVLIVLVAAGACSTPAQTSRSARTTTQVTGALGGASLIVTGYAFIFASGCDDGGEGRGGMCDPISPNWFYAFGSITAALLLTSVVAQVVHASVPEPPEPPPEPRQPTEAERAERERIVRERAPINERWQAFELLKLATRAARAGDCPTTMELGVRISTLSTHVYEGWFVHDDAIKRCVDAAAAPAGD